MKKNIRGCLTWSALVFSLALVSGFFFIRHQIMSSGTFAVASVDVRDISNILRELSLVKTEGKDKWSVWPQGSEMAICPNSTVFLRRLQKKPIEKLFSRPFVDKPAAPHSLESERCFFRENGESRWTILLDPSDSTPDFVPLILSCNIDVSALCDLLAGERLPNRKERLIARVDERGVGVLRLQNKGTIFLTNRSFGEQERAQTMESKFGGTSPSYTATYLTPTGLVTVTFRSP